MTAPATTCARAPRLDDPDPLRVVRRARSVRREELGEQREVGDGAGRLVARAGAHGGHRQP